MNIVTVGINLYVTYGRIHIPSTSHQVVTCDITSRDNDIRDKTDTVTVKHCEMQKNYTDNKLNFLFCS